MARRRRDACPFRSDDHDRAGRVTKARARYWADPVLCGTNRAAEYQQFGACCPVKQHPGGQALGHLHRDGDGRRWPEYRPHGIGQPGSVHDAVLVFCGEVAV